MKLWCTYLQRNAHRQNLSQQQLNINQIWLTSRVHKEHFGGTPPEGVKRRDDDDKTSIGNNKNLWWCTLSIVTSVRST